LSFTIQSLLNIYMYVPIFAWILFVGEYFCCQIGVHCLFYITSECTIMLCWPLTIIGSPLIIECYQTIVHPSIHPSIHALIAQMGHRGQQYRQSSDHSYYHKLISLLIPHISVNVSFPPVSHFSTKPKDRLERTSCKMTFVQSGT